MRKAYFKDSVLKPILLIFLLVFISINNIYSQDACVNSFTSANGYTVEVILTPIAVVAPASCPWGYNFNIEIEYSITFSGSNIPGNLNTLQGHMECGGYTNNFFNLPNSGGVGTTTTGGNPWNSNTDCASATVESLGCDNISLSIQGPALSNRTVNCAVSTPLPITLLKFDASYENHWVTLNWVTESEINNDYFTIERSLDLEQWEEVGREKGMGNSKTRNEYQFYDKNPLEGEVYYRLRQTDFDGKMMIYGPVVVESNSFSGSKPLIYPNPSNGNFSLNLFAKKCLFLKLYNSQGTLVWQSKFNPKDEVLFLPESLINGIYILQIHSESTVISEKLFLQRN